MSRREAAIQNGRSAPLADSGFRQPPMTTGSSDHLSRPYALSCARAGFQQEDIMGTASEACEPHRRPILPHCLAAGMPAILVLSSRILSTRNTTVLALGLLQIVLIMHCAPAL